MVVKQHFIMDARFPSSPWHGLTSRLSWKKLTWKKFLTVLIKPKLLPFMFRGELAVFTFCSQPSNSAKAVVGTSVLKVYNGQ